MSRSLIAGSALALCLVAQPAQAGTSDGTMVVSATVLESCLIVASPMTFGNITLTGSDIDSTSTLTLTCTPNADFDILMNDGVNADSGQRRLANVGASEFIPYDIYLNSARTDRWGNTIGTDTLAGTADGLGQASYTAYGRIGSGVAAVTDGAYSDAITVTVSF